MVAPLLDPGDLSFSIWEHILIELEITPLEAFHPETVEMENTGINIPLGHAVEKAVDSLLIVLGSKTRAQPKPKGPGEDIEESTD